MSADDDDLERVDRALQRVRAETDPVDAAAALAYEITAAQGVFEGNKRTATVLARWFLSVNTDLDVDALIPPDDREFADLLLAAARGNEVGDEIRGLLRNRGGRTARG